MEELHRRFKQGYRVEQARRGGHFKVLDPNGEPVRVNGRPIVMAGSPSDPNAAKAAERELARAGVLQEGPARKPRTSNGAGPEARTRHDAAKKAIATRQRARAQEAKALHDQLATLLVTVGGFDQYGNLSDLADIGSLIARENGDPMLTPDMLKHSIGRVKNMAPVEERAEKVWLELIDRLKNADKPSSEYFSLLRKARNIPEPDQLLPQQLQMPSGEWPFSVQLVPLEKLFIDHSYQRPQQWAFIRGGAQAFDSTLVGAIDVSDRGGRFAIMDGQQRFEMMRLIGKGTCWAAVYVGLDTQTESWFFIHKNKDRKNILPMHIFKAKITANDPDAVEISKTVSRNGYVLSLAAAGGENSEKNIASVAALEKAYELETLDPTLKTMHATTLGLRQGNSAQIIGGIALLYSDFPHLDKDVLAKAITARNPEWLLAKSAELAKTGGGSTRSRQMRVVLMGEYNSKAGRSVPKLRLA
jgi:hypothetical protein